MKTRISLPQIQRDNHSYRSAASNNHLRNVDRTFVMPINLRLEGKFLANIVKGTTAMRTEVNGKFYDTHDSEDIAIDSLPNGDNHLYQTKQGEFFLLLQQSYLDGRKLEPEEDLYELAPDLFIRGASNERDRRTKSVFTIQPLTNKEAVAWCVKTQIPKQLRGLMLDVL
ncbi:MAG: hypothetical protein ABI651_19895 [Verrucomicrobiota bacterium]